MTKGTAHIDSCAHGEITLSRRSNEVEFRTGNMHAAGKEDGTAMAISGHKTRRVFDRYGIQPEKTLIDEVRRREFAEKSAQFKREAGREPPQDRPN